MAFESGSHCLLADFSSTGQGMIENSAAVAGSFLSFLPSGWSLLYLLPDMELAFPCRRTLPPSCLLLIVGRPVFRPQRAGVGEEK